jgi:HPt (histidine-containing phosphotransfer) domain-containing protein
MSKTWVDAIAECEAEQGVPATERLAHLFVDNSKAQLKAIDAAVAQNSLAIARSSAHDLAVAAEALRFMQLTQVTRSFENACAANDQATVARVHKDLAPLVNICLLLLRARYKA